MILRPICTRSNARMDALAELMAKPDKSPFDEFITRNYSPQIRRPGLLEIRAINDLYAGKFKSAAELLAKAKPDAANLKLEADPFGSRLRDCQDCDIDDKSTPAIPEWRLFAA